MWGWKPGGKDACSWEAALRRRQPGTGQPMLGPSEQLGERQSL